jgi:HD-GYP domain-containing protein (c-di-GMP phosphodiesterase class II)
LKRVEKIIKNVDTAAELEVIKYAALLHDIGKVGIRDQVLLKDGSFSPEERAEMNTHPVRTREILKNFHFPKRLLLVPVIASQHHEKVNGKGYPDGLAGDELPLGSKILAVADVFDAMTSRRDYPKYYSDGTQMGRGPVPLPKVIVTFKENSGTHFDPHVVSAFLRCLSRALQLYRGSHFPPDYVDETIHSLSTEP